MFQDADIVCSYSRQEAIADGVLIDASTGDFAEVSRQHYKYPIAMTSAVFELIEAEVSSPGSLSDWKGVWHDFLWMSRCSAYQKTADTQWFRVFIGSEGEDSPLHEFKIVCHGGDQGEPVLTVMLPDED